MVLKLLMAVMIGVCLISGQVMTANADEKKSEESNQSAKKKKRDQRNKDKADQIIWNLKDSGAGDKEIKMQQKANKKYLGHEGEAD